jgi:hypothetical protein
MHLCFIRRDHAQFNADRFTRRKQIKKTFGHVMLPFKSALCMLSSGWHQALYFSSQPVLIRTMVLADKPAVFSPEIRTEDTGRAIEVCNFLFYRTRMCIGSRIIWRTDLRT